MSQTPLKIIDLSDQLPINRKVSGGTRELTKIDTIVVHCTDAYMEGSLAQYARNLAYYDIGPNHISSTGCEGITYHRLISQAGEIALTAPLESVRWHTYGMNKRSIGIALCYKVRSSKKRKNEELPSPQMLDACARYCANLSKVLGKKLILVGHRECPSNSKECPGYDVDLDKLRTRYDEYCKQLNV